MQVESHVTCVWKELASTLHLCLEGADATCRCPSHPHERTVCMWPCCRDTSGGLLSRAPCKPASHRVGHANCQTLESLSDMILLLPERRRLFPFMLRQESRHAQYAMAQTIPRQGLT